MGEYSGFADFSNIKSKIEWVLPNFTMLGGVPAMNSANLTYPMVQMTVTGDMDVIFFC